MTIASRADVLAVAGGALTFASALSGMASLEEDLAAATATPAARIRPVALGHGAGQGASCGARDARPRPATPSRVS